MVSYIEILSVDLAMLGHVEVFLRNEYALTEEVLVDLFAVRFGNEPCEFVSASSHHINVGLFLHLGGIVNWKEMLYLRKRS